MRLRHSLVVLTAAALALGGASAALAGPLDGVADPGPGGPSAGISVGETLGYALDLVRVGDLPNVDIVEVRIPIVAIVNELYAPAEAPVRNTHGGAGQTVLDMFEVADIRVAELVDVSGSRLGALEEFVNSQCGACFPSLGGPVGPVPVGPVGDEARNQVNAAIATFNDAYFRLGHAINDTCDACLPGLGGPIGPVPVGPVGEEDPTAG